MFEPSVSYLDPEPMAGELAAVSAALAMPTAGSSGLAGAADEIKALLLALPRANALPSPDLGGAWVISSAGNQVSVLGEGWSLTAHCVAGIPRYAQVMTDERLLSFDFAVEVAPDGSPADLRASSRSIDGDGAAFTFHADGRVMDDRDWQTSAREGLREAADEVGTADSGGNLPDGPGLDDALRGAAAAIGMAGAAGAGVLIGGILKKIGTPSTVPSSPPTSSLPDMPPPALPQRCAGCGSTLANNARFCDECGTPVAVAVPAAPAVSPAPSSAVGAATADHCPRCQQLLGPGIRFCPGCGAAVAPVTVPPPTSFSCPRCAAPLQPGTRFCTGCGISLT